MNRCLEIKFFGGCLVALIFAGSAAGVSAQDAAFSVPLPAPAEPALSGPEKTSRGFDFPISLLLPALPEARLDLSQPLPPPRADAAIWLPPPELPELTAGLNGVSPSIDAQKPAQNAAAPAAGANETPVLAELPPLKPRPEALIPRAAAAIAMIPAPETAAPALKEKTEPVADDAKAGAAPAVAPSAQFKNVLEAARKRTRLSAKEFQSLEAYYEARAFRPVWLIDGALNAAAASALSQIEMAADDGLTAARYTLLAAPGQADASQSVEQDIQISESVFLYARDARGGRISPARLSSLLTAKPSLPDPSEVLAAVSAAADPGQALRGYNPSHSGYVDLRGKLGELRAARAQSKSEIIADGPFLRQGMVDVRVSALRRRLDMPPQSDGIYDEALAEAVKAFQRRAQIRSTGVLDARTVTALNGGTAGNLEADIIANMERWRWLPRDLGDSHVFVNVPEFALTVMSKGALVHRAKIIVGKPETPTPIFSDTMRHLIVNPSWFIPPSILKKEILPGLERDPDYARRRGFEVITRNGAITGVRQPPGDRNALGYIKFMFPNEHAVYLHDTPARGLFANDLRAFSHGCVRVEAPFKLAEIVLGRDNGWSEGRLRGLIGKGETTVRLTQPLPVHLAYFTHWVGENGQMQARPDLYGFHRRVREALAAFK